MAELKI